MNEHLICTIYAPSSLNVTEKAFMFQSNWYCFNYLWILTLVWGIGILAIVLLHRSYIVCGKMLHMHTSSTCFRFLCICYCPMDGNAIMHPQWKARWSGIAYESEWDWVLLIWLPHLLCESIRRKIAEKCKSSVDLVLIDLSQGAGRYES